MTSTTHSPALTVQRHPNQLFIKGHWIPSSSNQTFEVVDPATGKSIQSVADARPADALMALDAAAEVAESWASTPPRTRADILYRAWSLVLQNRETLAQLITLEMGKPLTEADGEVTYAADYLQWFAEEAVRIHGRVGTLPEGTGHMEVTNHPVGPCFLVTPWNFPLTMATRKIAPALAAGCTIVLKPSELTPLTALFLAQLLDTAGLPAGVLNVIPTTDAPAVSEALMADQRMRKISFTGSTKVGKALLRQAGDNVMRTSMELGGNAPFLVFEDADMEASVSGAMEAKFRNSGQACTAANRFLVHSSIAAEFTSRLAQRIDDLAVGPGAEDGVQIGPLIHERTVDNIDDLVQDAIEQGAELIRGGYRLPGAGSFYAPTLLTSVPATSRIFHEEIFGPVVIVTEFSDEETGIKLANSTEYGLAAYAYSADANLHTRLSERLHTGMLGINVGAISSAVVPFGGIKHSGMGREGGIEGIHEYLSLKYTLRPAGGLS